MSRGAYCISLLFISAEAYKLKLAVWPMISALVMHCRPDIEVLHMCGEAVCSGSEQIGRD